MTPKKIGRYEVERELGQGGMAVVFLGRDPLVKRQVAIKVLPGQFSTTPDLRTRFQREAEIIAALEHPAIVPIYDYGEENNQPYIVMRYMPGGSLADRLRQGPLSLDDAARVLERIASALDRAHGQGIIHRDLKPGNILFDQYSDAYLSDFGIARLAEASVALTGSGVIGTPAYMSPEQVYGDADVDSRSDIYALGVILFEMLTGQIPYEADTPAKIMMKHILDPVPHIRAVKPDLPDRCEGLIERAMAKEVDKRYATAGALVADVRQLTPSRPLPHAPVASQDDGTRTEVMVEKPAASTPPQHAAAEEAPPVVPETEIAPVKGQAGEELTAVIRPASQPAATARSRSPWVWAIVGGLALLLVAVVVGGSILLLTNLGGGSEEEPAAIAAADVAAVDQPALAPGRYEELRRFGRGPINALDFTADGQLLAVAGSIGIWPYSTENWEPIGLLEGHADEVSAVAWSPDDRLLASGSWDGSVKIWDRAEGQLLQALHGHQDIVTAVTWSPDAQSVASASFDGTVRLWDITGGEEYASLSGHDGWVNAVAWSPDGSRIASGGEDATIRIWDVENEEEIGLLEHGGSLISVIWSEDGRLFAGTDDNMIRVWNPDSGEMLHEWQAHEYGLYSLTLAPDGQHLASTGGDAFVRIWTTDGTEPVASWGYYGEAHSQAWLNNSEELAVAFDDEVIRLWHFPSEEERLTIYGHTGPINGLDLSPAQDKVATGYNNIGTSVWNSGGDVEAYLDGYTSESHGGGVAWSPDGQHIAAVNGDTVSIWAAKTAIETTILTDTSNSYVNDVAWSPDGQYLATVSWDLLEIRTAGESEPLLSTETPGPRNLAWSPDGQWLVTLGDHNLAVVLDAEAATSGNLEEVATLAAHQDDLTQAAWSPDSQYLATASVDGTVIIWSVEDGWTMYDNLGDGSTALVSLAWSEDGRYLATGTWPGEIWLWQVEQTGEPITTLHGHMGPVSSLRWLDDGRLVSGGHDGTLRIWGDPESD